MAFINYSSKEINCKLVYCGPEGSGKTTTLNSIHASIRPEDRGKVISLGTDGDRTIFFDLLAPHLGTIKGMSLRFHLYTLSGRVSHSANWHPILKNVDGIVLVADSQEARLEANLECLASLEESLKSNGNDLRKIPFVLQLNKRDVTHALPVDELARKLGAIDSQVFETTASKGGGVLEPWLACSKLVMRLLKEQR